MRVHGIFFDLEPVTLDIKAHTAIVAHTGDTEPVELWQNRHLLGWAHVHKHNPGENLDWVTALIHLTHDSLGVGIPRNRDASTINGILASVVATTDAVLREDAEFERTIAV